MTSLRVSTSRATTNSTRRFGYHRRSMLVVPMIDQLGHVVGVLVFVNRKTDPNAKIRTKEDADRYAIAYTRSTRCDWRGRWPAKRRWRSRTSSSTRRSSARSRASSKHPCRRSTSEIRRRRGIPFASRRSRPRWPTRSSAPTAVRIATCTSRASRCASFASPRCCTTSARSRCATTCS